MPAITIVRLLLSTALLLPLAAPATEPAAGAAAGSVATAQLAPPERREDAGIEADQPSLWIIPPGSHRRELLRLRFYIRTPAQVVVLASTACRRCVLAAHDIEADPQLRRLMRDHAQWVAPPDEIGAYDAVLAWNRDHPELRLGIAHDRDSLPMVERFEAPTFYFLDHGAVVETVAGWPDGGNLDAIRRGLRHIHLLR